MIFGDWVRCYVPGAEPFVGTILRSHSNNGIHVRCVVRCVVNGVEAARYCGSGTEKLSLLEIVASESVEGYWPNPNMRICENEDCTKILAPNWSAVYCSNFCAAMDA